MELTDVSLRSSGLQLRCITSALENGGSVRASMPKGRANARKKLMRWWTLPKGYGAGAYVSVFAA